MKISIVTIVYNSVSVIEETLRSVHAQTGAEIEHIVIDGGSTDGTLEIISHYRNKIDTLISEPDKGIYDAMNKGAACATGSYVIFMNGGDRFYSDEVVADFVAAGLEADIVFGHALICSQDGREWILQGDLGRLLKKMPLSHQACFVRTEVQNRLRFDCSFCIAADYDFILRAHREQYRFEELKLIVGIHHLDGISNYQRFRASIESMHALLNYDPTLDHSKTEYYTKNILQGLLNIDNGKMLEQFIAGMKQCRQASLFREPLAKIKYGVRLLSDFAKLYTGRSK